MDNDKVEKFLKQQYYKYKVNNPVKLPESYKDGEIIVLQADLVDDGVNFYLHQEQIILNKKASNINNKKHKLTSKG